MLVPLRAQAACRRGNTHTPRASHITHHTHPHAHTHDTNKNSLRCGGASISPRPHSYRPARVHAAFVLAPPASNPGRQAPAAACLRRLSPAASKTAHSGARRPPVSLLRLCLPPKAPEKASSRPLSHPALYRTHALNASVQPSQTAPPSSRPMAPSTHPTCRSPSPSQRSLAALSLV